jgi:two-component system, chemotaxis family, sensor kinase CheA
MNRLLDYVILPNRLTEFEATYLRRMNRIGLAFFAVHLPVFCVVAYFNDTGPGLAALLTLAVLVGPTAAYLTLQNPRSVSVVYGFTSMLMGGLLVHFGQGPVQIEMHFYFFALLAMLAVYANPLVIIVAAVTVAVHHLTLWMYLPKSVFNYAAPIWVVAIHAAFVVLESIATCFIARSFFDNVIGLEKIVQARTAALDERNRDMRLVLGHVGQGFLTIDKSGAMSNERSAIIEKWLGPVDENITFADYLERSVPEVAAAFRFCWQEVVAGEMLLELTLDQMPRRFTCKGRHYELEYTPILGGAEELEKVLIVISDVTEHVEREGLEQQQREVVHIFERLTRDRKGFLEFVSEADEQVAAIHKGEITDAIVLKRVIHTLKGNALLFGIRTVGDLCHAMETRIIEERVLPTVAERAELKAGWNRLRASMSSLFADDELAKIELEPVEYEAVLRAVQRGEPRDKIARTILDWKLESTAKRLARVAEQAQAIARRLGKEPIRIEIDHRDLRIEPGRWAPFWSAFTHVIRNAVDHGLETPEERARAGKPAEGVLRLATRVERDQFIIEIADDGKGIEWKSVAQKASEKGLPHGTEPQLIEALFQDGITTSSQVNEYSGRGIGMGAARSACQARGGTVRISSQPGQGTRVEFRFARTEMAPEVSVAMSIPPVHAAAPH